MVVGVVVVVVVEVVTTFGVVTGVCGTVVRADVGGKWVAAVVGVPPVRSSTNTPTTTARTMTRAALRG